MEEVQLSEKRATLEDLMYASVLEKFLVLGVDMLGSMDAITENRDSLKSLTEGIHSKVSCLLPLNSGSTPIGLKSDQTIRVQAVIGCASSYVSWSMHRSCCCDYSICC